MRVIGGFCSTAPETTSQSVAPNPMAAAAYSDILSRAQNVASQPYTPYGGQLTAGLDPTQQAGISNINAAYGQAQPWFNQAGQYAQQGAAPVANISGADIQRYQNPFQQSVIDATMGNINEADQRQQQMVKGNAAMSGALGGDRQAVAQAELARQQGLARNQTLAGLSSQGYSQALAAAQSQQANQQQNAARALQGAGVYGNLGAGAQQAQLQGAGAQLGAGQVAQQTEQQRLNALYGQFQQQQAFPYQQLGWLSGIAAPIGSQMGQTQTNVGPEKDNTSQYLGMGLSAAAAIFSDERLKENVHQVGELYDGQPVHRYNYKGDPTTQIGLLSQEVEKDHPEAVHHINGLGAVDYDAATAGSIRRAFGGRVGYADGGSPYNFIMDSEGYIPRSPQLSARPMQIAPMPKQQEDPGMGMLGKGMGALAGSMGKSGFSGLHDFTGGATSNFGFNSSMMPDYFSSNYGSPGQLFPGMADGGLVDTVRAIRKGLQSYADGGGVDDETRKSGLATLGQQMGGEVPWYKQRYHEPWVKDAQNWRAVQAYDISDKVPRRRYQDGGGVDELPFGDRFGGELPFSDRWGPTADLPPPMAQGPAPIEIDGGNWAPQEVNPQAMADWRGGTDLAMADAGGPRVSPAVELPPEITAGRSGSGSPYPMPPQALGYDRSPMAPSALMGAAPQEAAAKRAGLLGLLTEEQQAGLMAAGAGMMSGSRNKGEGLRNLGLGVQEGMKAMSGVRKEELARTTAKRSADAEARKLMHDLRRDDLAERRFNQQIEAGKIPPGYRRTADGNLEAIPGGPGAMPSLKDTGMLTSEGHPVHADPRRPGSAVDIVTGQPVKPSEKLSSGKKPEPDLTPEAIEGFVDRSLAGDYSWKQNLGRGAQSGANIIAVENAVAQRMRAMGVKPEDMARKIQEFRAQGFGLGAEARTAGNRLANLNIIIEATDAAIPAALEASEAVSRTGWVPINKIIQKGQVIASNPDLKEFGMANLQLAEHWARAMNPTGVMRESDRDMALSFLSTADSKDTYKRAVMQLKKQIEREREGVLKARSGHKAEPKPVEGLAPQDREALDWANANPSDPRAAAIKKKLGVP